MRYLIVIIIVFFLILSIVSCSPTCHQLALPSQLVTGSDGACYGAMIYTLRYMNDHNARCVYYTNEGFIPSAVNPISINRVKWLVDSDEPY